MTVEDLITTVLDVLWEKHYSPREREFHRDRRALLKCIARYGHLCQQRNWHVEPAFIQGEILRVLAKIRATQADIKYLPAYLEAALTKSVGQRAEEISDEARMVKRPVAKIIKEANVVTAVLMPTAVEILAELDKSIRRPGRGRLMARQKELL